MLQTYKSVYDKAIGEGKTATQARVLASIKSGAVGFKKIPIAGQFYPHAWGCFRQT